MSSGLALKDSHIAMKAFQDAGNEMLAEIRKVAISPDNRKCLKKWGSTEAAKMIGTSIPTLHKKDKELGNEEKDSNNRKVYSLKR